MRPTVIFGEGNRGNVFNLFNQIASKKFIMIGDGKNKKSMAYVGNVVAFLEACIESELKQGLYNYVDTPTLTMKELVSEVQKKLHGKPGLNIRIPYWFGLILGHLADFLSRIRRKNYAISAIRIKKFISSSEFKSSELLPNNFVAPFELYEGLQRTLISEFISPDPEREIFYTE